MHAGSVGSCVVDKVEVRPEPGGAAGVKARRSTPATLPYPSTSGPGALLEGMTSVNDGEAATIEVEALAVACSESRTARPPPASLRRPHTHHTRCGTPAAAAARREIAGLGRRTNNHFRSDQPEQLDKPAARAHRPLAQGLSSIGRMWTVASGCRPWSTGAPTTTCTTQPRAANERTSQATSRYAGAAVTAMTTLPGMRRGYRARRTWLFAGVLTGELSREIVMVWKGPVDAPRSAHERIIGPRGVNFGPKSGHTIYSKPDWGKRAWIFGVWPRRRLTSSVG